MIKRKSKIVIIFFIIVIVFSSIILPQNRDSLYNPELYPFIVDSIAITGNEKTEEFIILRELNFSVGDTLSKVQSFYNRERVYSLGIFNHVYFIPTIVESKRILTIEVAETWYFYPIPFLDARDGDLKKLTYGVFLRMMNFRGRNEDLTATVRVGYDPLFSLGYYNPNTIGNENIFVGARVGYADISNRSVIAEYLYGKPFSQKSISANLTIGKRFGLFNRFYINTGYNYIETPFYISGINASGDRIDNLVDLGIGFEHDTRDLIQFPTDGIFSSITYVQRGLGLDNINYGIARIDFREYRELFEKLISKWRFTSRFTVGKGVPYYDYSRLDGGQKIRGHYNEKYEGNDYYFGSTEFYYPIIKELNIDLTFLPIIPDALLSYRVGFYTQIFAETGLAKLRDEPFAINKFNSGYGFGITLLILPYQVLRVEAAFNEQMKSELIIDLGISF
ncbi:MAG: BamA/TamA family outer membrane protein [Ignavibacteriaceae bacterium]|nr:BamA/TamA family outer membrane protein [Ignavibacterium sp.]MCC6254873.1 BamA/TamA family outer membrane protein [Ignavibacteriaceae bacterium]